MFINTRIPYLVFIIIYLTFFGFACTADIQEDESGSDTDASTQDSTHDGADFGDATRVSHIIVTPNPVEAIKTQNIQMSFRAFNRRGIRVENATVTWHSEDPQIASITDTGLLYAREVGQTSLIVASGEFEEVIDVRVRSFDSLGRLEIVPEQREVGVGRHLELAVKGYHEDGHEVENLNIPVEWTSQAPETASVDTSGNLTGLKRGAVQISASVGDLETSVNFRVELKFVSVKCLNGCYVVTTEGDVYVMSIREGEENDDGIIMPEFMPLDIDDNIRIDSIYGGPAGVFNFSCALSTEKRVYCWGNNNRIGVVGVDYAIPFVEAPTALNTELRFKALGVGAYSACGLTLAGALYCWGNLLISGEWYEQGLEFDEAHSYLPVLIDEGPFSQHIMSGQTLCAQDAKTQVWRCMGANRSGELGNGERVDSDTLVMVNSPSAFSALDSTYDLGGGGTKCGVDLQGQVWCWSTNTHGERGEPIEPIDSENGIRDIPTRVAWDVPMQNIENNGYGFCGVTADREIRCWGDNTQCYLGQPAPGRGFKDYRFRLQPPIVGLPENWQKLTYNFVITEDGDLWAWGLTRNTGDPVWPTRCEPTAQRLLTF